MNNKLYKYQAVVKSVYDGDTCTVDIDLGLGTWVHGEKLRLYRINAPEVRGVERSLGLKSRDFLRSKIDDREIIIKTVKDKKGEWININDLMVSEGFAVYKDY
ncbi:MAG TPA: nuclease [Euryarchaeota archaeon]|nr:nuclease [Euryarchaeota archaeon]